MILKRFFEFFPTPRFLKFSYVGLDIGNERLRYAELLSDGSSFHLGRYGMETFEKNDNLLSNESLKSVLKRLQKEKNIHHAKVSLPEEETYLFTTEVTGQTDKEIRDDIEFHLEENVPIAGAEALFHYYLVPSEDKTKKKAVVSVVSRETINRYSTLLADCGITPVSFMVESSALSRSVVKRNYNNTHLLVYLSRSRTILAVVDRGFVQFSSTTNFGGGAFTSAIQKEFSISAEEARKLKYSKGIMQSGEQGEDISSSVANAISVLRDEIQRVSAYWLKQPQGSMQPIEKIVLCGTDSSMPGLADYLAVSLKTPVEMANVWSNIPHYNNEVPPIPFEDSLSYGTSIGLVLSTSV